MIDFMTHSSLNPKALMIVFPVASTLTILIFGEIIPKIVRAKSVIPSDNLEGFEKLNEEMNLEFKKLLEAQEEKVIAK